MAKCYRFDKKTWDNVLVALTGKYRLYAPLHKGETLDYALIDPDDIPLIAYNEPKPATPLKTFLLPVRENVVKSGKPPPSLIMGIPACDLAALDLLDAFYLHEDYTDRHYAERRKASILIGGDCYRTETTCHCASYGLNPFPEVNHDVTVNLENDSIFLEHHSKKGEKLVQSILEMAPFRSLEDGVPTELKDRRQQAKTQLEKANQDLPNYQETSNAVANAEETVWKRYSRTCVSCGACAAICPTCTCFLLIDRPGFEKIRQLDACQYPGFERMAGGEDPLKRMDERFGNRYFCKYKYRPEKHSSLACTGCGRCIDSCIGKINKNELIIEMSR